MTGSFGSPMSLPHAETICLKFFPQFSAAERNSADVLPDLVREIGQRDQAKSEERERGKGVDGSHSRDSTHQPTNRSLRDGQASQAAACALPCPQAARLVGVLVIAEMEKAKAEIDAIIDATPGRGS